MNNSNTMSKKYYIHANIFYSAVALFLFHEFLFRPIGDISYFISKAILYGLMFFLVAAGILCTWQRRRNKVSLAINVIIPLECYALASYSTDLPGIVLVMALLAILLSALYSIVILARKIRDRTQAKAIISRRIIHAVLATRTIAASCFFLILLYLASGSVFGIFIFSPASNLENNRSGEEITIANNIDIVARLDEDIWRKQSDQDKLMILQTIADIEAYYLGLPHDLGIELGDLAEKTLACYNDGTHLITININHFNSSSARRILNTVCHEAYHAYQYRLCDVYDNMHEEHKNLLAFYEVKYYKEEFANYADGSDSISEYYEQWCEVKARSYAKESVADYYGKINAHLGKGLP